MYGPSGSRRSGAVVFVTGDKSKRKNLSLRFRGESAEDSRARLSLEARRYDGRFAACFYSGKSYIRKERRENFCLLFEE